MYGKAHLLPFGNRKDVSKPGELISTDVCGQFKDSFSKNRYLVVFKDGYTKFRYGYLLKDKYEVQQVLKHANKQEHLIKELLSDNRGEFDNAEVKRILNENGIVQRLTAPYTPQQNGGSERENRTIIEIAKTLQYSNKDAIFPEEIWAELVSTVIYVLNRTGKTSLDGKSI